MSAFQQLQHSLPIWTRLERKEETPVVVESMAGGVKVTEVNAFPETPPAAIRADVHFVNVGLTEGSPTKEEFIQAVHDALGEGEFGNVLTASDLVGGPSYITLGAWLGSQDLALMLIGAAELLGVTRTITPATLGMSGALADTMAGQGLVMLGPYAGW